MPTITLTDDEADVLIREAVLLHGSTPRSDELFKSIIDKACAAAEATDAPHTAEAMRRGAAPSYHTPGPYETRPVPCMNAVYIAQVGYMPHASVFTRGPSPDPGVTPQMTRDATLFAAAPDMLAALKRLALYGESGEAYEQAAKAIAKAGG